MELEWHPMPDPDGQFSWTEEAARLEQQLGRELTVDELQELRERTFQAAIEDILERGADDREDRPVRDLVFKVTRQNPTMSTPEIRDVVRRVLLQRELGHAHS